MYNIFQTCQPGAKIENWWKFSRPSNWVCVVSFNSSVAAAGFLFMPLVWSLPEALVTAELATTFPSNAGFVVPWIWYGWWNKILHHLGCPETCQLWIIWLKRGFLGTLGALILLNQVPMSGIPCVPEGGGIEIIFAGFSKDCRIFKGTSPSTTCETDGFCLRVSRCGWWKPKKSSQLLGLIYLLPYKKCQKQNCNISSPYFIAHIMRSLTPLENYYNIQYPLKNWWLMRFSIFKMGSWNQGTKRRGRLVASG